MRAARSAYVAALAAALLAGGAHARTNATGAIAVFMIDDCKTCTTDGDSIWCSTAKSDSNYVSVVYPPNFANTNQSVNIGQKKQIVGAGPGSGFCWEGTFGKMLNPNMNGEASNALNSAAVWSSLGCENRNLFYRQCVLTAESTVILISIAIILFVLGTTCCLFVCGCCKCCNNPGDESKYGMCNRFCPWMPCSDPPEKKEEAPSWMSNPQSEEENRSSLFGRNPMLSAQQSARLSTHSEAPPVGAAPALTTRVPSVGAGMPPPTVGGAAAKLKVVESAPLAAASSATAPDTTAVVVTAPAAAADGGSAAASSSGGGAADPAPVAAAAVASDAPDKSDA